MEVRTAIEIALTTLTIGAALSAVSWARNMVSEVQRLRDEVLSSIDSIRDDVAVRRVIRNLNEVPPELMSLHAKQIIKENIKKTGGSAAMVVQAAIELGVRYSEMNRICNKELGFDEDEIPSSKGEGEIASSEDENELPGSEPEPK